MGTPALQCMGCLAVMLLVVAIPSAAHADEYLEDWIAYIIELYAEGYISADDAVYYLMDMMEAWYWSSDADAPFYDDGYFLVWYDTPSGWEEYEDWIMNEQYFENQASWIEETFILPYDVHVLITTCDESNAFYDSSQTAIIMCYELFRDVYLNAADSIDRHETDPETFMWDVIDYVFYHELGHALIDVYDLPYTGLQEDAADQFAFYIMTEFTPSGGVILESVAWDYFMDHERDSWAYNLLYADTHQLHMQRMHNVACFLYGSNPTAYADWRDTEALPEDRAVWCIEEYEHGVRAWNELLAPYFVYQ